MYQKITKTTIKVFVSENDTPSSSSVSPYLTVVGCHFDNNNDENYVGNILIDMSNMTNNNEGENIVGNNIENVIDQHDLPNDNMPLDECSYDSSFCLSSRDEEDNKSLFGSSDSCVSINEDNISNNENEVYCLPVSEQKTTCYGRLSWDFVNCTNKGVALKYIQPPIKVSATASKRNHDCMVNAIKAVYRNECLKRIGIVNHVKDKGQKIGFCYNHKIETIMKEVEWISKTKKKETKEYNIAKMNVPVRFNVQSTNHHRSNRSNRATRNVLQTLD